MKNIYDVDRLTHLWVDGYVVDKSWGMGIGLYLIYKVHYWNGMLCLKFTCLLSIYCLRNYFPLLYRLSKARSSWKLVRDPSHYPTIIPVDFDILVKVIIACIGELMDDD